MAYIYLDYNATTPLEESVIRTIREELSNSWANPSSSYHIGQLARGVIENARRLVAEMLRADPSCIVFTSGCTESSNMAILSVIKNYKKTSELSVPHVVSLSVEHDATLKILEHLKEEKEIELSLVNTSEGEVTALSVLDQINNRTCLISLHMANNETGVIFPVSQIGKALKAINRRRQASGLPSILLHTDAAQAVGKFPVHMEELAADYVSITGSKFYGTRVGILCFRKEAPLWPMLHGGGQENGLRPGTENTPMIAGIGEAARLVTENIESYSQQMRRMRDLLQDNLEAKFSSDEMVVNFTKAERLPNTLSVSFLKRSGQGMLSACKRVLASTGSACHSSAVSVSRKSTEQLILRQRSRGGTVKYIRLE